MYGRKARILTAFFRSIFSRLQFNPQIYNPYIRWGELKSCRLLVIMLWEICFSLLSTVSAGGVADGDEVLTVHVLYL